MQFSIQSRKLGRKITFSRPGSYYIFVDLDGKSEGVLGDQICSGGCLSGSTIGYNGDNKKHFQAICKKWFKAYIASL